LTWKILVYPNLVGIQYTWTYYKKKNKLNCVYATENIKKYKNKKEKINF